MKVKVTSGIMSVECGGVKLEHATDDQYFLDMPRKDDPATLQNLKDLLACLKTFFDMRPELTKKDVSNGT